MSTTGLRSGRSVWQIAAPAPSAHGSAPAHARCDVAIVGAGITGAFLAERLTREGRSVVVIDSHAPQRASTAASTALLLWEIDSPMLKLEDALGFATAAAIYRRSFAAVGAIAALVHRLGAEAAFACRPSLYLAGARLDAPLLLEEQRLRARAGLPSRFLDTRALAEGYRQHREAALVSQGAAEADPVRLARALLDAAIGAGARVFSPALAVNYDTGARGATLQLDSGGAVEAHAIVLANGYEMPPFVPATRHRVGSTWAVATAPQAEHALWPERALIWEAATPYSYLRTTSDNRIVIGGEDEDTDSAERRAARIAEKSAVLRAKLAAIAPEADTTLDAAWSGAFGETDDGLPLIGAVPGAPRCFAAFGYGGNGITFSAMAADILSALLAGRDDPMARHFAVDR